MKKFTTMLSFAVILLMAAGGAEARYQSRFEVINFDPAVDGGDFLNVYGTATHDAWQGNLGFYIDYGNQPLQIKISGPGGGTQSIIDGLIVADLYGAIGFTDWFTAGVNLPVDYNIFTTDDALAQSDNGGGLGDIDVVLKFRLVDIDKYKIGVAFIPNVTLPSGDVSRYTGNGAVTGGATIAVDLRPAERFHLGLNVGAIIRDDVVRSITIASGVTGNIHVASQFKYGLAGNLALSDHAQVIAEVQGSTVLSEFFQRQDNSPIEVDGAFRYLFSHGFAGTLGGGAGILEGIGNPRFRAFAGLNWTSPKKGEVVATPPPDPRIVENKIILMGKIFYDTAKATIKPESYPVLDDVVDVLNKNAQVTLVEIQGHCDNRGSDAYNMRLSDARANSARNYLISKGIDGNRLTAHGYGESQPIASNSTPEGMSQNRRTEFVIREENGHTVASSNVYVPSEPRVSANVIDENGLSAGVMANNNSATPTSEPVVAEVAPQPQPTTQAAQPDASHVYVPKMAKNMPEHGPAEVPSDATQQPPYGEPTPAQTNEPVSPNTPSAQPDNSDIDAGPIPGTPVARPVSSNADVTEGANPSDLVPIQDIKPEEFPPDTTSVAMN
jgi:outer membrane protein OmpA-like peptidoglycan-associated protein